MPGCVVVTREKTRDQSELDAYKKMAPASFTGGHAATFRVRQRPVRGVGGSFPPSKRRRHSTKARPIDTHQNTASKAATIATSSSKASNASGCFLVFAFAVGLFAFFGQKRMSSPWTV